MDDSESQLYRINERDGSFQVVNDSGSVVLACHDEASAINCAVLLTEAYQRGYNVGYRDAKKLGARGRKV